MAVPSRLVKTKIYPRPHDMSNSWGHGLESAVVNQATIYPILMNDEGLGTPSAYEANPRHASFVEASEPNCFPESRVDLVVCNLTFALTKAAIETDKVVALRAAFMPIFTSFDDYLAKDELSTFTIADILELITEDTDNQGAPLFNNVKMKTGISATQLLYPANVPGMDTNQNAEAVAFSPGGYYDMLHYLTNAGKLKAVQGGLKWVTLTANNPIKNFKIKLRSKSKRMVDKQFFGVMVFVPSAGKSQQYMPVGDTTDIIHMIASVRTRYNEWNPEFNMKMV